MPYGKGPKKSGLSHFWQMIWHETGEVAVIVMLTPTEESGREKCFQYFPLDAETSPFKIKAIGLAESSSEGEVVFIEEYTQHGRNTHVRKLHLNIGSETKTVWHLLFTAFPDFGVPEDDDRAELLDLIKLSAEKNDTPNNPRTIHCSAGVGRSGTFIALEYLLSELDNGVIATTKDDEDPIFDLVRRLREQRMMMVQSDVQYQFLYDVLLEKLQKTQLANPASGQPSPKLMKLAGGMKAAMLDEFQVSNESSNNADANVADPGSLGEANALVFNSSAQPEKNANVNEVDNDQSDLRNKAAREEDEGQIQAS